MVVATEGEKKRQDVLRFAQSIYSNTHDWVAFFRRTLGVKGVVQEVFATPEELAEFEQSAEFHEIQQMVSELRKKRGRKKDKNSDKEPTKVITVRMPKSLHELLSVQAEQRGVSINNLCISKLLRMIENDQTSP